MHFVVEMRLAVLCVFVCVGMYGMGICSFRPVFFTNQIEFKLGRTIELNSNLIYELQL